MTRTFKPGDRVVVTDERIRAELPLPVGSVHVVAAVHEDCLDLVPGTVIATRPENQAHIHSGWLSDRFNLVKKARTVNTSVEAIKQVKLSDQQATLLAALQGAGSYGYTSAELDRANHIKDAGIKAHKRLPELARLGKAKVLTVNGVEQTRKVNGRSARVWIAA